MHAAFGTTISVLNMEVSSFQRYRSARLSSNSICMHSMCGLVFTLYKHTQPAHCHILWYINFFSFIVSKLEVDILTINYGPSSAILKLTHVQVDCDYTDTKKGQKRKLKFGFGLHTLLCISFIHVYTCNQVTQKFCDVSSHWNLITKIMISKPSVSFVLLFRQLL